MLLLPSSFIHQLTSSDTRQCWKGLVPDGLQKSRNRCHCFERMMVSVDRTWTGQDRPESDSRKQGKVGKEVLKASTVQVCPACNVARD